jgi:hypothetical protein
MKFPADIHRYATCCARHRCVGLDRRGTRSSERRVSAVFRLGLGLIIQRNRNARRLDFASDVAHRLFQFGTTGGRYAWSGRNSESPEGSVAST